jgi:hypothetical protein
MAVRSLPLDPEARARALLHHLLEAGDVIGRHAAGRTVIQVAADDWLLEQLDLRWRLRDLEDGDAESDDCGVLSFDWAHVRRIYPGR